MTNYDEQLVQRLREQYMDTKQMLPNVLCHDSADAITALQARVAELERRRVPNDTYTREIARTQRVEAERDRLQDDLAAVRALLREVLDCDQQAIPDWLANDINAALAGDKP